MNTSKILCLLGLTGLFSLHATEKPNVLLILVDDLKPALGCYGDKAAISPNIDALAARGMRFDLAYCNQAVCAPSRFTLMLGSHSTSTGLYGLGNRVRQSLPDAVTIPQHFARYGYRTESLGKIFHIGHGNEGDPESFSVPHFKEKVIEYVDPASTHGGKLTREEAYFTNQKLGQIRSLPRGAAYESPEVADNAYADGRVAEETIRRLKAAKAHRNKDKVPFFIATGFARPHLPFSAPKKYWKLHNPDKLPLPKYEALPENSPSIAHKRGGEICNYFPVHDHGQKPNFSEELKRNLIHGYYASVSYVDAQIGKVITELDRLDLSKNTIIVLWGDHGFHLGDLGIWTKHTNYEQANRIPILVIAPGVAKAGSSTRQPVESVDIFPTLAELAGLPKPKGPQPIDGKSLVSVLKDPKSRIRDHAYHAYPRRTLGRAIRTERYRMVEWRKPGEPVATAQYELYDYESDPHETENHAKKQPEVMARLKAMLSKYPEPFSKSRKKRSSTTPKPNSQSPMIANKAIRVTAEVQTKNGHGVVICQGGQEQGYALHFIKGKPAFDIRVNGRVTRIIAPDSIHGSIQLEASLDKKTMRLSANGKLLGESPSPGLIPVQPKDSISIGQDELSAAGDYLAPNPFNGKVIAHKVQDLK
jgi:iduronate 2-sulfatase